MNKGVICISIDTELLWGRKDLDYSSFIESTKKERGIIKALLNIFQTYHVPATWAVVGKLLEKDSNHSGELWYGKDIVDLIKKTDLQEIASHSYSHEIFSEINKEEAEKEVASFKAVSFVYPRNKVAYLNLLKKHGFATYRGPDKTNLELLAPRTPPVYEPAVKNGLVNIPGSMYFVSARGVRRYIPFFLRILKAKLGINSAIRNKKVFHLWFHPIDLLTKDNNLVKCIKQIIEYAKKKEKEGKLKIMSMEQIASEFSL